MPEKAYISGLKQNTYTKLRLNSKIKTKAKTSCDNDIGWRKKYRTFTLLPVYVCINFYKLKY